MYQFNFSAVWQNWPYLINGIGLTLLVSAIAMLIGVGVGLLAALLRLSNIFPLKQLAVIYIEFFRDTPLLVQVIWFFFCIPIVTGLEVSAFVAGTMALGLNAGAFLAEIFRAGIQSVSRGQTQAAESLGLSWLKIFLLVVAPQATRLVLPPVGNAFISLVKDSSLVSVIAVAELMRRADEINTKTYRPLEVYTTVAIIYFVLTLALSQIMLLLERRSVKGGS